jgi:hypothetical protein
MAELWPLSKEIAPPWLSYVLYVLALHFSSTRLLDSFHPIRSSLICLPYCRRVFVFHLFVPHLRPPLARVYPLIKMPKHKDPNQVLQRAREKGSNQNKVYINGSKVRRRLEPKILRAYLRQVNMWY